MNMKTLLVIALLVAGCEEDVTGGDFPTTLNREVDAVIDHCWEVECHGVCCQYREIETDISVERCLYMVCPETGTEFPRWCPSTDTPTNFCEY